MNSVQVSSVIDEYFKSVKSCLNNYDEATPSGIFELNTSRTTSYVRSVLENRVFNKLDGARQNKALFWLMVAKQLLKWSFIIALAKIHYRRSEEHKKGLESCSVVMVGFAKKQDGKFHLKDFEGFSDSSFIKGRSRLVVYLKLPSVSYADYFGGEDCSIPLLAHVSFSNVWGAIVRQIKLLSAISRSSSLPSTYVEAMATADFFAGHSVGSDVMGQALANLINTYAGPGVEVYFPFERHDWEQIALHHLKPTVQVKIVQSCTFSPLDLNMYRSNWAPAYRQKSAGVMYVINQNWLDVVFKRLNLDPEFQIANQNRIVSQQFPIRLNSRCSALAYIGSINREKVKRDIATLAGFVTQRSIHVRLHPSMSDIELPNGFENRRNLDGEYQYCFFADTSMVFQMVCDPERLVFISHPDIPSQNPTAWFASSKQKEIKAVDLASIIS